MKIIFSIISLAITISSLQASAQNRLNSNEEKYLSKVSISFEEGLMRSPDGNFIVAVDLARINLDPSSDSVFIRITDSNNTEQKFFEIKERGEISYFRKNKFCISYYSEERSTNTPRRYIYTAVDLTDQQTPKARVFKIKQLRANSSLSSIQQVCKGTSELKGLNREDWEITEFDLSNTEVSELQ